jgi:hypothetical protein
MQSAYAPQWLSLFQSLHLHYRNPETNLAVHTYLHFFSCGTGLLHDSRLLKTKLPGFHWRRPNLLNMLLAHLDILSLG